MCDGRFFISIHLELRVYLKSRKFSLFLQTQPDFALKSLGIHKGFLRLFALNPACACEIFVIFFVFRYTLVKRVCGKSAFPCKAAVRADRAAVLSIGCICIKGALYFTTAPFFARQTVLYYNSIGACRKGSKPVRFTQGSVSRARCTEKAVF